MRLFTTLILLSAILFPCSGSGSDENPAPELRVVLEHPHADRAILALEMDGRLSEKRMRKEGEHSFSVRLPADTGEPYLFNIRVTSDTVPGAYQWIGTANGIRARQVSIAGMELDDGNLVRTGVPVSDDVTPSAAFSVLLGPDGTGPGPGEPWLPDSRIPAEVPQYHFYNRYRLPPPGFTAALPWMQALHTGGKGTRSLVEVDYLRLYARVPSGEVLLISDDYDEDRGPGGYHHGGTYLRHPFFFDEENHNWAMPGEIRDGVLRIRPGSEAGRAFHWWTSRRITVPPEAEYLRVEARVRIIGDACVQAALDYRKDTEAPYAGPDGNNIEGGVSDFIFGSTGDDWQVLEYSTRDLVPWAD